MVRFWWLSLRGRGHQEVGLEGLEERGVGVVRDAVLLAHPLQDRGEPAGGKTRLKLETRLHHRTLVRVAIR
jgi:hypothetical protein